MGQQRDVSLPNVNFEQTLLYYCSQSNGQSNLQSLLRRQIHQVYLDVCLVGEHVGEVEVLVDPVDGNPADPALANAILEKGMCRNFFFIRNISITETSIIYFLTSSQGSIPPHMQDFELLNSLLVTQQNSGFGRCMNDKIDISTF